jgi:POT family proton-dependent oligopeptide transporter
LGNPKGTAESILASSDGRAFLGHPKGLFFLAFTEAWVRFSYYGMTALLMLYRVTRRCCRATLKR